MKRNYFIVALLVLLIPSLFLNIFLISNINGIITNAEELLQKTTCIKDELAQYVSTTNSMIYEIYKRDVKTASINGKLCRVISENRNKGYKILLKYMEYTKQNEFKTY